MRRGPRENMLRMIALEERLIIVPAHDIRAFAEMPRMPKPSSKSASFLPVIRV